MRHLETGVLTVVDRVRGRECWRVEQGGGGAEQRSLSLLSPGESGREERGQAGGLGSESRRLEHLRWRMIVMRRVGAGGSVGHGVEDVTSSSTRRSSRSVDTTNKWYVQ